MSKRWLVALGASIGLSVGFGPVFIYSFGLFQKPLIAEFGWSRAQISLGFSIATLITAVLNVVVGSVIDKYGARRVILAGVVLLPAVLVAFSRIASYPGYLLTAVAMSLAGATTSYPGYIPLLPPWFKTRLGLAFSIAAAGVGYGAFVASLLTERFIRDLGWRQAFIALAGVLFVIGLLNVGLLIRDKPGGVDIERALDSALAENGAGFRAAARSGRFWRLTLAFSIIPLVGIGINFHFAALLSDRGYSAAQAAGVIGVTGIAIVAARLSTGVLLDYISARLIGLILFSGQALAALTLAMGVGGVAPYFVAALLGAATGGEGDLMPYVLSKLFGDNAYGRIYGTCFAFFNLGTLIGPLLLGAAFGIFHSYTTALFGLSCLSCVSALLVWANAPTGPLCHGTAPDAST